MVGVMLWRNFVCLLWEEESAATALRHDSLQFQRCTYECEFSCKAETSFYSPHCISKVLPQQVKSVKTWLLTKATTGKNPCVAISGYMNHSHKEKSSINKFIIKLFHLSRYLTPCCSKGFSVPRRNFKCASDVCGHTLLTWVLHLNANKLWKRCLSFISFLCHTNKRTCTDTVKHTHSHTLRLAPLNDRAVEYLFLSPGASGLSLSAVLEAHVLCGCNRRTMCSGTKLQRVPSLEIPRVGRLTYAKKILLLEMQWFSEY